MSLDPRIFQTLTNLSEELNFLAAPQNNRSLDLNNEAILFLSSLQSFIAELAAAPEMSEFRDYGFSIILFAVHGYTRGYFENNSKPRPKLKALIEISLQRVGLRGFND